MKKNTVNEAEPSHKGNQHYNKLFRTLIENALDIITIIDDEGIIRYESPSIKRFLGYRPDELIGRNVFDLLHSDDIQFVADLYRNMMVVNFTPEIQGHEKVIEARLRHKDGTWRILESVTLALDIPPIKGILINSRDITDRKQTEKALRESQQMLRQVLDTIPVRVFWKDTDSNYLGCNKQLVSDLGISSTDKIIGKNDYDMVWSEQADLYRAYDRTVIETGLPKLNYVQLEKRTDGSTAWLRTSKMPLIDAEGNIKGVLGTYEDITESKQAEEALRKSEERYRIVADNTYDWEFWIGQDDRLIYSSPSCKMITGHTSEEFFADPGLFYRIIHPDDRADFENHRRSTLEGKRTDRYEIQFRIILPDGTLRWIGHVCQPVFNNEGRFLGTRGSNRDITERKQTEERLLLKTEELNSFFNLSSDLLIISDMNMKTRQLNPAWERTLGYSLEEFKTRSLFDFIHPDDVEQTRKAIVRLSSEGEVADVMNRFRCKDGSYRYFEWRAISAGNLIYSVARDITEHKQAEDALRESEERYRITLQTLPDAVSIMGCHDLQYLYVNDTFCRMTGYTSEELMGKTPYDVNLPATSEDGGNLHTCITDTKVTERQAFKFRVKDGTILDTLTSCSPISYGGQKSMIVVVTDVTPLKSAEEETKRLESQLSQAQKLEALGTLAGGIAHDFNNILAAIIGYTELAMYQAKSPEKVQQHLTEVLKSSKRARDIVSQILAFSRQSEKKYAPAMLSFTIKETLSMLRQMIPANIEVRQNLLTPGYVMADQTQIHQMMMNLSSNAVQAMGERGGVLDVNLEQVILDESTARTLDLIPGSYLKLTVSDTGHGMTPELVPRIFEPYFTTRDTGKGTGLGLSIVHGIVIRHRGAITCESKPGKGTAFKIYLPVIEFQKQSEETPADTDLPLGKERILFIDDEPALGDIAKKFLENLGYKVITKTSSKDALNLFMAQPDQFDLVITDMTMPGLTGDNLAQKMLKVRRNIPIILCTGYSEHITEEKVKSLGIKKLLMKPLEMGEFAHSIRKVLGEDK